MTNRVNTTALADELLGVAERDFAELDDLSVDDLKGYSLREAELAVEGLSRGLIHGIQCGAALCRIRDKIAPGTWTQWLEQNFPYSAGTAMQWRRYYTNRKVLIEAGVRNTEEAQRSLKGLPSGASAGVPPQVTEAEQAEMALLQKRGWTHQQIADHVGWSHATVRKYLNPEKHRKTQARAKKRRQQSYRALKRQAEAKRRREAAKAIRLDRAYSEWRQFYQLWDNAITDCDNQWVADKMSNMRQKHLDAFEADLLELIGEE